MISFDEYNKQMEHDDMKAQAVEDKAEFIADLIIGGSQVVLLDGTYDLAEFASDYEEAFYDWCKNIAEKLIEEGE